MPALKPYRRWFTPGLIALALFAYFWTATGKGLLIYFYEDDLMNLYRAIDETPGWRMLTANLTPFTPVNRPMGALYYKTVFALGGYDPYPFRVVFYGFLIGNAALLYLFSKRLSGLKEVAVIAVLIGCYHHRFIDLYTNNGTIYDVLCVTFYLLALLAYFRWRSGWVTILLYIPALNAKEMAASLPLVLFAYELIYNWPLLSVRGVARWLLVNNRAAWVTGLITVFAIRAKTSSAGAFYGNSAYKPVVSWHNFVSSAGHWLDEMLYTKEALFGPWAVVLIWAGMLGLALASRRRYLVFAFALLFLAPLPVSFIPPRGFFVMYLPWVGWSLFLAGVLVEGRNVLYRRVWKRPPIPAGAWQPERIALFVGLMAVLAAVNAADPYYSIERHVAKKEPLRDAYEGLRELHPTIPPHSKVLILNDNLQADTYMMLFLVRLVYGHDVELYRPRQEPGKHSTDPKDYNYVWDYRDGKFVEVKAGAAG